MTIYSRELAGSDEQVLRNMGKRLADHRVRMGFTQAQLAEQAGIGKRTVERIEAGHSAQMLSMVRLLRVLDLFDGLELMVPEPAMSPLQIMEQQKGDSSRVRKRVSTRSKGAKKPWVWGDEQP